MRSLFVLLILSTLLHAKSFYFQRIEQTWYVRANGDVEVEERRSYAFNGAFSRAYLSIRKRNFNGKVIKIHYQGVYDETGKLLPYNIKDTGEYSKITWNYKAKDQIKTFTIRYKLIGAVEIYQDIGRFFWKILEDRHEKVEDFRATIILERPATTTFKVFVHPSFTGISKDLQVYRNRAQIYIDRVPKNQFVEVDMAVDNTAFSVPPTINTLGMPQFLEYERKVANYYKRKEEDLRRKKDTLRLMTLVPTLFLLYVLYLYLSRRKTYPDIPDHLYEPPSEEEPITVTIFGEWGRVNVGEMGKAFAAELIDMAVKGSIQLITGKDKKKFAIRLISESDALTENQKMIYRFLKRAAVEDKGFSLLRDMLGIGKDEEFEILNQKDNRAIVTPGEFKAYATKWGLLALGGKKRTKFGELLYILLKNGREVLKSRFGDLYKFGKDYLLAWLTFLLLLVAPMVLLIASGYKAILVFVFVGIHSISFIFLPLYYVFVKRNMSVFLLVLAVVMSFFYVFVIRGVWNSESSRHEDPLLSTPYVVMYYIPVFITMILLLLTKPKYNPAFLYEVLRWEAFKKFLKSFTLLKEAPIDIHKVWDKYMVYAAALGVADKFMKNVERLAREGAIADLEQPGWYVGGGHFSGGGFSTASVTSGLSSLMSALSSSSGFGGGGSSGAS